MAAGIVFYPMKACVISTPVENNEPSGLGANDCLLACIYVHLDYVLSTHSKLLKSVRLLCIIGCRESLW